MTTRPTTLTAYRWEQRKLVSQKRTYIGIGAAALLPVLFVVAMAFQTGGPYDVPLGRNLRHTGVPLALVVLTFALPLRRAARDRVGRRRHRRERGRGPHAEDDPHPLLEAK